MVLIDSGPEQAIIHRISHDSDAPLEFVINISMIYFSHAGLLVCNNHHYSLTHIGNTDIVKVNFEKN